MCASRSALLCLLLLPLLLTPRPTTAHGSVTAEGDLCVIRIGFYTAHFKIFQTRRSGHREYCEDLPAAGESIFVMEYEHQELARVPVEFRIIRDATGLGRFARSADVEALGDLTAYTVFHQAPTTEPLVFTVLHDFRDEGDYLGIVTVVQPQSGQTFAAVFPFHVGPRSWGLLPLFVLLAVLAQASYWFTSGGYRRWRLRRSAARGSRSMSTTCLRPVLLTGLLLGAAPALGAEQPQWLSTNGAYRVGYTPDTDPPPLNRMHAWILHLEDADGHAVENAELVVAGGMPAHNHGLPTAPQVTAYLGNGNYRVEGLRFHMQGPWELRISINHAGRQDTVVIPLVL